MSKSIHEIVDDLPSKSLTTRLLGALDSILALSHGGCLGATVMPTMQNSSLPA